MTIYSNLKCLTVYYVELFGEKFLCREENFNFICSLLDSNINKYLGYFCIMFALMNRTFIFIQTVVYIPP